MFKQFGLKLLSLFVLSTTLFTSSVATAGIEETIGSFVDENVAVIARFILSQFDSDQSVEEFVKGCLDGAERRGLDPESKKAFAFALLKSSQSATQFVDVDIAQLQERFGVYEAWLIVQPIDEKYVVSLFFPLDQSKAGDFQKYLADSGLDSYECKGGVRLITDDSAYDDFTPGKLPHLAEPAFAAPEVGSFCQFYCDVAGILAHYIGTTPPYAKIFARMPEEARDLFTGLITGCEGAGGFLSTKPGASRYELYFDSEESIQQVVDDAEPFLDFMFDRLTKDLGIVGPFFGVDLNSSSLGKELLRGALAKYAPERAPHVLLAKDKDLSFLASYALVAARFYTNLLRQAQKQEKKPEPSAEEVAAAPFQEAAEDASLSFAIEKGPAFAKADVAKRMQQLGLGLHGFLDANNGRLPAAFSVDDSGKPLHSWRVYLLPYLGEQGLYSKIRLDEPWDSEWNKQFHGLVPECYRNPRLKGVGAGYSVVVDEKSAFPQGEKDGRGLPLSELTDGTSFTVAFVERVVPCNWMDPNDGLTTKQLIDSIVNCPKEAVGLYVVYVDGRCNFTAPSTLPENIAAWVTRNGGETIAVRPQ